MDTRPTTFATTFTAEMDLDNLKALDDTLFVPTEESTRVYSYTKINIDEDKVTALKNALVTSVSSKSLIRDRISYINKVIKRKIRLGLDKPKPALSNEVLFPLFLYNKSVFNFENMFPPPTLVNPWLLTKAENKHKEVNNLLKNWLVNDILILPTNDPLVFNFKVKLITGMVLEFSNINSHPLNTGHEIINYIIQIIHYVFKYGYENYIDPTKWKV